MQLGLRHKQTKLRSTPQNGIPSLNICPPAYSQLKGGSLELRPPARASSGSVRCCGLRVAVAAGAVAALLYSVQLEGNAASSAQESEDKYVFTKSSLL